MPKLDIGTDRSNEINGSVVWATMHFPDTKIMRSSLIDYFLYKQGLRNEGLIQRAFEVNLPYPEIKKKMDKIQGEALIAGRIIVALYFMSKAQMKDVGIAKAAYAVSSYGLKPRSKRKAAERKSMDLFKKYNSVAHLWGALQISYQREMYKAVEDGYNDPEIWKWTFESLMTSSILNKMLATAKSLQEFGEKFVSPRMENERCILNKDTWEVPSSYLLPEIPTLLIDWTPLDLNTIFSRPIELLKMFPDDHKKIELADE